MQKRITYLIFSLLVTFQPFAAKAKEGMWLPYLLEKVNSDEMQRMGMIISAEEIYSLNQASLKDAIVHFGRGCTGEIVSEQGLVFTNHHCGYGEIQSHSTLEHDYLTQGFWAASQAEELTNPGLQVRILTSMEEVTQAILKDVTPQMTEIERTVLILKNSAKLKEAHAADAFHEVEIKAFYYGNQYIMMKYDVFQDVRLVGAPPSNIGKFGGDTDNWMWPRHTGDFSVFRIYADADNNPAAISTKNVPYRPKSHLKISLKGVKEGDFTFIFGYPGRTQEYISAEEMDLITSKVNPFKIDLRRQKLDIMSAAMETNPQIRIQYSAKYAGVANGWKKWIGENRGIKRMNSVDNKRVAEKQFIQWCMDNQKPNQDLIPQINEAVRKSEPYEMAYNYYAETVYYHDLSRFALSFTSLIQKSKDKTMSNEAFDQLLKNQIQAAEGFYKDYNRGVDQAMFAAGVKAYLGYPYSIEKPQMFKILREKYDYQPEKYSQALYSKSKFSEADRMLSFLKKANRNQIAALAKDPIYVHSQSLNDYMIKYVRPQMDFYDQKIDSLQRLYMAAYLEYNANGRNYPDANSTLRVSYGIVEAYQPADAVDYNYFTTLEGIMAKENPDIYDYVVEPKLKELYKNKDYGRYKDEDGSLHTCFIASNHTTGGNSGSPALNANGALIGINFDRNWEGTMSDLDYDPNQCRNIMLDIRYCLFVIEKYAGAQHLIEELEFVE